MSAREQEQGGARFTPGPLRVDRDREGRYLSIKKGRDLTLATVYGSGGDANDLTRLPQRANADLFAAAPDLYEALAAMLAAYPYHHGPDCPAAAHMGHATYDPSTCVPARCSVARARAAIAKAEGRAP